MKERRILYFILFNQLIEEKSIIYRNRFFSLTALMTMMATPTPRTKLQVKEGGNVQQEPLITFYKSVV